MGSIKILPNNGTFAVDRVVKPAVQTVVRSVSEEIVNVAPSSRGGRWASDPSGNRRIDKYPDTSDLFSTKYWHHVRSAHLPSGRTYRYVRMAPKNLSKPYLLLLHGFPSSSYDFRRQFDYFHERGYGILAPDLLGYGGTDKPEDLDAYRLKNMARDIIELLDCEGIGAVLGVSHDLGSPILGRIANYYPERVIRYVFMDVGYVPPPINFSTQNVKPSGRQAQTTGGFTSLGYWSFFSDPSAGAIVDSHQKSLRDLFYTDDPHYFWRKYLNDPEMLKTFLESNSKASRGDFVSEEDERVYGRIFKPIRGGYGPALNHFRALYQDINAADEAAISQAQNTIKRPVLLLTATRDPLGTPRLADGSTRPYAANLRVKAIDAGHFLMLEKAKEVNGAMEAFFEGK